MTTQIDTTLSALAADMIAALAVPGCAYVHRTLRTRTGPLPAMRQIAYQRTGSGYRLALGDDKHTPPLEEAQALALAFNVPAGVKWVAGIKRQG